MIPYGIDTCALLVEANISIWTAKKLDRGVTDELVTAKGAGSKSAARVNKSLLAGRPELEQIQKHVNAARAYLYDNTLPWSNAGVRLLPTKSFFKFNERMGLFEEEFQTMVEEFVQVYPSLITAQAMALGDMFNRADYPLPESMARKFSFKVNFMPVPAAGDFRIDVGLEAQEDLRKQLEQQAQERTAEAVNAVKARLGEHLERMSDRLGTDIEDGQEKPRRFHASLIDNAHDLCEQLVNLNVTGDASIEEARAKLEAALGDRSAEVVRESVQVRLALKVEVDNLLKRLVWEKE